MSIARSVVAELLDGLGEHDPAAIRSRRDLRRVHRVMGTRKIIDRALRNSIGRASETIGQRRQSPALQVLELGAGDGSLTLDIARTCAADWPPVALTLLDRQDLLAPATVARYAEIRWTAQSQVMDVFDWARSAKDPLLGPNESGRWDLIVANLFLHHFEGARLRTLLAAVESRTDRFLACEPRRAWLPLLGSHLIGALGVNAVTRHDAVLSVRAGFRDTEVGDLWPSHSSAWVRHEYPAGLFSHCFRAERSHSASGW